MKRFLTLAMCAVLSINSAAMSRKYDYEAGAVLKNGKPCFYTNRPVDNPPIYSNGNGVHASVYIARGSAKWDMWSSQPLPIDSVGPSSCIPYGQVSPDENRQLATELEIERPYYFSLTGQYGRYGLYFCLKQSAQGEIYLSQAIFDDVWVCSAKPLPKAKSKFPHTLVMLHW